MTELKSCQAEVNPDSAKMAQSRNGFSLDNFY
ncbi:hypothetical protein CR513_40289 [Mucuna pruriens]|uniref:Uncharacterized protein n=1 Tax=Mucuna pruriens TaxID=157652 RepID=A0A371FMK4_MUCPR|nr:hypothetical protein CR513_40289 [Mucuna pruriens]